MEEPATETPVSASPKVMTPVPEAFTVPETVMDDGAVAMTPPVKVVTSEPSPNVRVPVLPNVVVPAMELVPPVKETL